MRERPYRLFKSLTGRLLAAAGLWTLLVLAGGGFVLSHAFSSYVKEDMETRLVSLLDTVIGFSEVGTDNVLHFTRPLSDQSFETPYSGWYWQISEADHDAVRSRSLWDMGLETDMTAPRFQLSFREGAGPDGQVVKIAERDIVFPEAPGRVFRFIIAVDTATMRDAIARFDKFITGSLAIIAVAIFASVIAQITYALYPIRLLRRSLADVRKGLKPRVTDDLPDDLLPLSGEINALIDHNEKLIERARTHVGNLAHALKTPLSVIANIAKDTKDIQIQRSLQEQSEQMLNHINHHLQRARIAGGGTGKGVDIGAVLEKNINGFSRLYKDKGVRITSTVEPGLFFDGEKEDLSEIIGNLLDNACKWCAHEVEITAGYMVDSPRRPMLTLIVDDDGPGVKTQLREGLFQRGKRLDEKVPGTGLGLHITREITELYGGQIFLKTSSKGGLRVLLILPAKGKS